MKRVAAVAAALAIAALAGCSRKHAQEIVGNPVPHTIESSNENNSATASFPHSATSISTTPGTANGAYQIGPQTTLDVGMGNDVAVHKSKHPKQ